MWEFSYRNILDREITENPCCLIDEVSVSRRVALVVGLPVDSWKSPEHTLFCHGFDIAVYRRAPDIWTFSFHFFIDILSGEMPALTSRTDDVSILVFAHERIMRKNLRKSIFLLSLIFPYTLGMSLTRLDWAQHNHIGLDLDETLASTVMGMLDEAHSHGKLLGIRSLEDITKYDFLGLDPTLTEADSSFVWESYGQKTLDPQSIPLMQNAKNGVQLLEKRGIELSIITARSDDQDWKKPRTIHWVHTHLPTIKNVYFVNHFSKDARPKSDICKSFGISMMIDDHIENALDLIEHGIACILLEKPWNRNEHFEHPLLYRVKDWEEIIASLQK